MNIKEREELLRKVEKAKEQIAELRKQQSELEREKAELEELKGKQEEWIRGRKEVGEELAKSCDVLEREEAEAVRLGEMIRTSREKLSGILDEIRDVKEDRWSPDTLKADLDKALLIVQKGRSELSKARGRISALERGEDAEKRTFSKPLGLNDGVWNITRIGAVDLLRLGFWIVLPLVIMLLLLGFIFYGG